MEEAGFEYKAKWDKRLTLFTWGLIIFLLYTIGHATWIITHSKMHPWSGYVLGGIVFLTIFFAYLYSPAGYAITSEHLAIKRPLKPVLIKLSEIEKAEAIGPDMLEYSFRLWGSGGLFGYFGLFTNEKLGKYTAYLTNYSDLVLIKTGKTYVISPDRRDEFLAVLYGRIRK